MMDFQKEFTESWLNLELWWISKRNLKSYDGFGSYDGFSKRSWRVMIEFGIMMDFQKEFK
jgi:hypothetical protein